MLNLVDLTARMIVRVFGWSVWVIFVILLPETILAALWLWIRQSVTK